MKTVVPKKDSVESAWYILDGSNQVLGRLASQAAVLLRGKHKPAYTPHLDLGDHVVIINAEKVKVTGHKTDQKVYTRYSGYPGGLKKQSLQEMLNKHPERVLTHAVKGMLPKNRLGRKMIKKLKIYTGPEHPHQAQKPVELPEHLRRA